MVQKTQKSKLHKIWWISGDSSFGWLKHVETPKKTWEKASGFDCHRMGQGMAKRNRRMTFKKKMKEMKQEQWEGLSPENRMLGLLRLRRDETEWIHRHIEGLNHPKLWIWHLNPRKSSSHRGFLKPAELCKGSSSHQKKNAPEMWSDARRATNSGLVVAVPVAIGRCSTGLILAISVDICCSSIYNGILLKTPKLQSPKRLSSSEQQGFQMRFQQSFVSKHIGTTILVSLWPPLKLGHV